MKLVKFTSKSTGKEVHINPDRVAGVQPSQPSEGKFTVIKISESFAYHVEQEISFVIGALQVGFK